MVIFVVIFDGGFNGDTGNPTWRTSSRGWKFSELNRGFVLKKNVKNTMPRKPWICSIAVITGE